ncbi:unnamed protein product, partial [Brassica rapa]
QTAHVGQNHPISPRIGVSVLSPRTNVLICVPMDSHGRPVCADGHTQTHTDSHRRPMYVLCVLNRQPTWAKITQTVHGKGHRAESKNQHADMCTDGQPRTSYVPSGPKSPEQSTGRASVLSPRTNVLICVLMDSHRRPVCADGHRQTRTDTHGQPQTSCVCWWTAIDVLCVMNRQSTWAKITRSRAESKDQRADMCTDGQPRTSCVC